jgi:23S rRNA (cytidine2498-2'-O)-methyltransferase
MHLLSCHPGMQDVLQAELLRLAPDCGACADGDGWVAVPGILPVDPVLAFATQVWPDAEVVEAPSITRWAHHIVATACASVRGDTPWRLQLFAHGHGLAAVSPRRLDHIAAAVTTQLQRKQRRLVRSCRPPIAPFLGDEVVISVAFTGPETGAVSTIDAAVRARWSHVYSRFPGGYVALDPDPRPPARAYRKLREALAHLDVAPSDCATWVDLGAAPGSWTYDAVHAGARVWAIDRSPLRDDLMALSNLTFVRGDAFTYRPEVQPVTMLACDVIAFPARSIGLLRDWLAQGLCEYFIVTLKFRGTDDYAQVDTCKPVLAEFAGACFMRQLYSNKNEVTVAGRCRLPARD